MALIELCGLADAPFMNSSPFSRDDMQAEMMRQSSNMENCFQLAVPPYEKVRLCLAIITSVFTYSLYTFSNVQELI